MTNSESNPYLSHRQHSTHKRKSIEWPPRPAPRPHLALGNYQSYYGKRGDANDRIKLFQEEWFKDKRVIDIGCNAGHVAIDVASKFGPSSVIGIDIDPVLVRKARNQLYRRSSLAHQGDLNYFPIMVLDHFGTIPIIRGKSLKFPHNVQFRAGNWLEEPVEAADVLLALSITKWIHLNYGDDGLERFFKKCYKSLAPGGILILEPQSWETYHKRIKNWEMERHYNQIKLKPEDFPNYLISSIGFTDYELIGTGDNSSKGFRRNIYLFRK